MAITKLPSGRYRAQVYDKTTGKTLSAAVVLGLEEPTFRTKTEARAAVSEARSKLKGSKSTLTVRDWAEMWTSDPLYERPKASTNLHNAERIRRFVERFGDVPLANVGDAHVAEWIAGGQNLSTIPSLKAMFNDAASAQAGRLVTVNPFMGLKLRRSKGRRDEQPPTSEQVAVMLEHARRITSPSFAAWLQVACFTGMRPGELDALQWANVDFDAGRIAVVEQFNAKTGGFSLPKNGLKRNAPLTGKAREALLEIPRESPFCFVNSRGSHWAPSARNHHWDRVRTIMGWLDRDSRKALYLCTRHHAGWYMINTLGLDSEIVAVALGHEDGGEQVRQTYGHRDREQTLDRVIAAYEQASNVVSLDGLRTRTAHDAAG